MGVKSLTSYLEYNTKRYFEPYQLHDCNLVIDGSSLCYNLFNWNCDFLRTGYSYQCYGGDYDKYAEVVKRFFKLLQKCNIVPYIVFGGLNGIDRVKAVIKDRIIKHAKSASEITPGLVRKQVKLELESLKKWSDRSLLVGEVCLKYVFREIIRELNLKIFTCDEDPNQEIALLAKYLKCPVLSANSDFFVLGSMLIPFSSLECRIKGVFTISANMEGISYWYVSCKIYKIENLLVDLCKRPNNSFVPCLLPILLGSEYVNPEIFGTFFQSLKIQGRRHEVIQGIFKWIARQNTLEAALKELLDSFDNEKEKNVASEQINRAIMAYSPIFNSPILEHFGLKPYNAGASVGRSKENATGSELFMKRLRECRYPPLFMDMVTENRYLIQSNIDDYTQSDANTIGYIIIAAIHNILVQNDKKQLTLLRRGSGLKFDDYVLPVPTNQLPSIEQIGGFALQNRLNILLEILEIDQTFCQIFEEVPKEWHLFLLSLKYTSTKTELDSSFIYSLIFCFIILNYVDLQLKGFYRTAEDFKRFYVVNENDERVPCEKREFFQISPGDSFTFMEKCIKYFEMSEMANDETYNRGIMHSIAEFQCVVLHLKYLNNLLDFPIPEAFIYKVFDNTFIYNMTENLRDISNLNDYLHNLLDDCHTVSSIVFYIRDLLEIHYIL